MTIDTKTTMCQLQIELAKQGVTAFSWGTHEGRHVVMMQGTDSHTSEGFGMTFVEALDDALTSWTQALGAMLARAD